MRSKYISKTSVFSVAVFCTLLILSADFSAQTRRPAPKATPPANVPIIISRAEDFPDENTQVQSTPEEVPDTTIPGRSTAELRMLAEQAAAKKDDQYDTRQRRLLMNLDILTRAEDRAENLRKQLFDMIEKENEIQSRLSEIEYDVMPETIDRNLAFTGSLRPEDLRDKRKKSLEAEKANQERLMTQVQERKNSLTLSVQKADDLVDKLRQKLERDIDEALIDDTNKP